MKTAADRMPGAAPPGIASTARPHFGVQTIIALGFLLTAGTWLFAGSYFGRRMQEIQQEAVEVSRRYMQAQAMLSDTRAEVYRASISVRDALLDDQPDAATYIDDVEAAYRKADELLATYVPVMGSRHEHERAERLRRDISELRDANLGVLATDSRRWRENATLLITTRLKPKREAALVVANELQTLNRNAYVEQQTETAQLYADIQERYWRTFGMAVLATLCIAVFSALHVHRLERRLRLEQDKDARTAAELQHLSAKLVSAQEEERRTIARELHDEIGQVLTVVKIELAHAQRYIASLGGNRDFLEDARSITDRALDAARDMSHLLHPSVLDDLGLPAAVEGYIQRINKRQDLRVDFTATGMDERLPAEFEIALYRIVQEALTNVIRHAEARRCAVRIVRDAAGGSVELTVTDDGVGFDSDAVPVADSSRGLGLVGMRERVTRLGGHLQLESRPGTGTRLTVRFEDPGSSPGPH
jgi:signal transduction histidine kinase